MSFLPGNSEDPFVFDFNSVRDLGSELRETYQGGDPFPHIVIDDFLPTEVVNYVLDHFPTKLDPDGREFNRDQERLKRSYHPDYLTPRLRNLFYAFNSRPFIRVVENITGIKGLIPDPYYLGAGFHEIQTGGHLSMHADFNHHVLMNLERRVNLLIYLNRGWKEEYGGQLELWTTDMTRCAHSVVPVANRCAIFTTTDKSMHGNPQPVAHPDGISRKSIALYYYTSTWSDELVEKNTQFHARPGTTDVEAFRSKPDGTLAEFLPPILARKVRSLRKRLER